MNITGNILAGQVTGYTAKQLSERFGRILQNRNSVSSNRMDTSISQSQQLDAGIPPSRMAILSSGEFVGLVADDPHLPIALKAFHSKLVKEGKAGEKEKEVILPLVRTFDAAQVQQVYNQVKRNIEVLVEEVLSRVNKDPGQAHLKIRNDELG